MVLYQGQYARRRTFPWTTVYELHWSNVFVLLTLLSGVSLLSCYASLFFCSNNVFINMQMTYVQTDQWSPHLNTTTTTTTTVVCGFVCVPWWRHMWFLPIQLCSIVTSQMVTLVTGFVLWWRQRWLQALFCADVTDGYLGYRLSLVIGCVFVDVASYMTYFVTLSSPDVWLNVGSLSCSNMFSYPL